MTTPSRRPLDGASRAPHVTTSAQEMKAEGNKAFAAGDLDRALEQYSSGLERCTGDSSSGGIALRATLHINRAAVLLRQGKAAECAVDCGLALELDPGNVKAYFRRALSREQLGEDGDALRDAKRAIELDPGNKEAVRAARRIKDKVAQAAKENTPIRQALKALREAAAKVQSYQQSRQDTVASSGSVPSSKEDEQQYQVLLALGALLSRDPSAAVQLLRGGGMVPLTACMKGSSVFPRSAKEALRALGAAAQHKAFGVVLLETQGTDVLSDITEILGADQVDAGVAESAISAAVHLLQWDEQVVTDGLDRTAEVNRGQVEIAGKDIAGAAVSLLAAGLRTPNREIFDTALEAAVRWCATSADSSPKEISDAGLSPKEAYERRQNFHRRQVRGSLWIRDKGLALLVSPALVSLYKALSSEEAAERRKSSACLSRIGRAVTSVQANEKERELDSNKIKEAVKPLLQFQSGGVGNTGDTKAEGEVLAVTAAESRMQGTIRRVATAAALANAEGGLGSWAMSRQGFLGEAMTLAATGDAVAQEAAAESFCSAASFDGGRSLLGPVVESGVIFALMESRSQAARSAAASAYAKLGMISSALSSDSDDVTKLLNVSLDLIAPDKEKKDGPNQKVKPGALSPLPLNSLPGKLDDMKAGPGLGDSERAVEVLSFLVSKTKVKEELCYGSARCPKALSRLCKAAQEVNGTSPIAYGLAFLFSSLCVSKEEEVKESFKGKDMTYEQYEQLKKLNDSHGQGPKEDETDAKDSPDAAKRRSHALAEAGCILSLKKIAEGASLATNERIALCFRRLATEPLNRGLIVQQGGLGLLITMASVPKAEKDQEKKQTEEQKGKGCIEEARHAIAKTLVSTNPNLLTEAQTMGSVPPLIAMCRDHESLNLQQFEGLLALTNLASVDNVKSRIIAEKGISCFQYLQFSDHEMVRRASTEALCNLLPHEQMFHHLRNHDTLKLFAAFAQLGTEDPPTAAAALGCIAMGVRDPENRTPVLQPALSFDVITRAAAFVHSLIMTVANGFMADGVAGCEALVFALLSVAPDIPNANDIILRAAVATTYLADNVKLRPLLILGGVADALTEAITAVNEVEGMEAARAAEACTSALDLLTKELTDIASNRQGPSESSSRDDFSEID